MARFVDESNGGEQRAQPVLPETRIRRRSVSLLLGSDVYISGETRVALTPQHLVALKRDLEAQGLQLRLSVMAGAGLRAATATVPGYADEAYTEVGATIVPEARLAAAGPFDVVHALKEPTAYESLLPGPFLRLGALHLASKPSGVCQMLARRPFAAIFDGGTVGDCAYLRRGGDRTPIVGSMSRFAGTVAGVKLCEGLDRNGLVGGKVVVIGGGIAGRSAIAKLPAHCGHLLVVEPFAAARQALQARLPDLGFPTDRYTLVSALTDEVMDGAAGIVFAHRTGAQAAAKVCDFAQIQRMKPGAAVVDIAIDQGGSIRHDGYLETDDATTSREKYQHLLAGYAYYAETNMPREAPRDASEMHGDASLPYVQLLLWLCAAYGGPSEAVAFLRQREVASFATADEIEGWSLFDCMAQDLRNGIQLTATDDGVEIAHPDIAEDRNLAGWIRSCAGD